MRSSTFPLAILGCLACITAVAEVPASLKGLDVSARELPAAFERFLASPEAEHLSPQDAFYLLGASHTFWVKTYFDENKKFTADYVRLEETKEKIRTFVWKRAAAAGIRLVKAIANQDIPLERGWYPEVDEKPCLTAVDALQGIRILAISEAREWVQLAELEQAIDKIRKDRAKFEFPDPPPLKEDLVTLVPQTLVPMLELFSRYSSACFAANQFHPPQDPSPSTIGHAWPLWRATAVALVAGLNEGASACQALTRNSLPVCGGLGNDWPRVPPLDTVPILTRMLEEMRWSEAAGYALLMEPLGNSDQGTLRATELSMRLLEHIAPRWEEAVLGKEILELLFLTKLEHFYIPGQKNWLRYATSANIIQAFLESRRWSRNLKLTDDRPLLALLDLRYNNGVAPVAKKLRRLPLPESLRQEIIAEFVSETKPDGHFARLAMDIDILAQVDAPDSRTRLREFLRHRSATVANQAAKALRGFGETVPERSKEEPLTVRFLFEGKPLGNRSISWNTKRFLRENVPTEGYSYSGITDEDGVLRIPMDYFHGESLDGKQAVLAFTALPSSQLQAQKQFTLGFTTPFPPTFGKLLEFSATGAVPQFEFSTADGVKLRENETMEIFFRKPAGGGLGYLSQDQSSFRYTAGKMSFPPLQTGEWEVKIRAYGIGVAVWQRVVNISSEAAPIKVTLQKGSEVAVGIPKKISRSYGPWSLLEVFQGDKRLEMESQTQGDEIRFGPLPVGSYRLRLPASAKLLEAKAVENAVAKSKYPRFEQQEVSFTITQDTGQLLDLGEFPVELLESDLKPL